ncbi:MAG TPA: DUF6281 family protein [Nocardioidaceae bacterium]|nr:DUF6281 family protein [Nocardioidaceae bacterium]
MPRNPVLTFVVATVGVLALAGCAEADGAGEPDEPSAGGAAGGAASCVAAVTFGGELYIQVDAGPVTAGESLEGAEAPPCNDTGADEAAATPVDAFAIEGVDSRFAVVSEGGAGQMVYVAEEYAPVLVDSKPLPQEVASALGIG